MNKYKQTPNVAGATKFISAPMAEVEFSKMTATPTWILPFNAGDIVPIYYAEILPHDSISISLDSVIRQTTVLRPTMGQMNLDIYAFFVPNRIVNDSWKNVMGENSAGVWSAPEVSLAPLVPAEWNTPVQIPVGSVADYYGFPTQLPIRAEYLKMCNDLKFKGYLSIYNSYFRDQNYQPAIPLSKLNTVQGFMQPVGTAINFNGLQGNQTILAGTVSSGSASEGAIVKSLLGEGSQTDNAITLPPHLTAWSALSKPLKANKLHDAFTSVLPSPQKGPEIYFGIGDYLEAPLNTLPAEGTYNFGTGNALRFAFANGNPDFYNILKTANANNQGDVFGEGGTSTVGTPNYVTGINAIAAVDLSKATGISVNELRTAIATQHVYETLARGGSRYSSVLRNFFGLETESPYPDEPIKLGHIRRELDLYQVAQTSGSADASTPQGTLTAFGYTTPSGHLFSRTFIEHGYIHIFAVVRQKNLYSTYFAPDNFRLSTLDFYIPQLANIGEQPVPLRVLNPFVEASGDATIGYQEAWWEYRSEPDRVHGMFRSGLVNSEGVEELNVWTYADDFDSTFTHVNGQWLKSNAEEVMNRTLAVTSDQAPQLKGLFKYRVEKQRPLPTYSVPGLDTI